MTSNLVLRQQGLVNALLGRPEPDGLESRDLLGLGGITNGLAGGELERGLLAYRLNAQALAAKALAAVFTRTQLALGDEASFAAMAWAFWRSRPPEQGDLGQWGGALPAFLAEQDGMPQWLCDLARIEWAAHRCERAADSELDAASLGLLSEVEPQDLHLLFRPGLQLLRVDVEAWDFWSATSAESAEQDTKVGLVIARKAWSAQVHCLQPGDWALMKALSDAADLEQALQQAFALRSDFDFSAWLQAALLNGWLLGAAHRPRKYL